MSNSSRFWPYIRAIARALKIPHTTIGPGILTDVIDQQNTDRFRRDVIAALDAIHADPRAIVDRLKRDDAIEVTDEALKRAALDIAEALYLAGLANKFLYADFKGIEQMERLVPLKLDDIFVNLQVRPQRSAVDEYRRKDELLRRLEGAPTGEQREEVARDLIDLDADDFLMARAQPGPLPVDRVLARPGGFVMLGGPGSGKTTLVKRLARSCALGRDALGRHYPDLPWSFPVVLPVAVFDHRRDGRGLFDYVQLHLEQIGGKALAAAFADHWAAGGCLLLFDGLDEVADTGRRIGSARAIEELFKKPCGNRLVVTSRPVGYDRCQINVPCEHVELQPFGRQDVETFVRNWHLAYDRAVRPERPDPDQAEVDARKLIDEIFQNLRVESLAANPLMLTIIALIKQQHVTLPERRVELYEIALNTLIRSWNKARSLSGRPVAADVSAADTKKIWAAMAYWMHAQRSAGTCPRELLQQRLVEILCAVGRDALEAERIADSYINAAAEHAGLLEERGPGVFAFMHQTFQEYLAARHLAVPHGEVIQRVLDLAGDPRWHEVIRLCAGYIGVVQEDDEMVTELVTAIANDDRDPLEPFLCTRLRLAAACIADQVRVKPSQANQVVVKICHRLHAVPYDRLVEGLGVSLASMSSVTPDDLAVKALTTLAGHGWLKARMEAARMLSRVADRNDAARDCTRKLFLNDPDVYVRAHAAVGLWRAGDRSDENILNAIAVGFTRSATAMQQILGLPLVPLVRTLLKHQDPSARYYAAKFLGNHGYQADATETLLDLLECERRYVRSRSADVLASWNPQPKAAEKLVELLKNEDADIRYRAKEVLEKWKPQSEAVLGLKKLLTGSIDHACCQAAAVLGHWGHQSDAAPVLHESIQHKNPYVRFIAVTALGTWEPQANLTPKLVSLLGEEDAEIRYRAAVVLGEWNEHGKAVPALLKLLEDNDAYVRHRVAALLGAWGPQRGAVRALIHLLQEVNYLAQNDVAAVLRKWGPQAQAVSALTALLQIRYSDHRTRAAEVLSTWGPGYGAAANVLRLLIGEPPQAVVKYLDEAGRGKRQPPTAEVAQLLVRAIKPAQDDSPPLRDLRDIVFQWLWQASEAVE